MCAVPPGTAGTAPALELADIVRTYGDAYAQAHRLTPVQHRALRAITTCRTAALGGHQETCDHCGATRIMYNVSEPALPDVPDRRPGGVARRSAGRAPSDPVLPRRLHPPARAQCARPGQSACVYTLLFRAAADTLLAFGRDPQHLGGTIGVTAILHTWGQNLSQHLHLHCLVTGGALAPDGTRWIPARSSRFLFPVRALATVFRAKFLAALDRAFASHHLTFAGGTAALADPTAFARFRAALRTVPWVVYAKRPFAGPAQVLAYLGRYTHRVALTNQRLVACDAGQVSFRWKDYADGSRTKIMTLPVDEFLRRFLLHIVPARFMRIRHFGLLANRRRATALARCRQLLGVSAPVAPAAAPDRPPTDEPGAPPRCPFCQVGHWIRMEIQPHHLPRPPALDSS